MWHVINVGVVLQIWARHFFVLTAEKLFFTEEQDKEEEQEKEEEEPEVCMSHAVTYLSHAVSCDYHVTAGPQHRTPLQGQVVPWQVGQWTFGCGETAAGVQIRERGLFGQGKCYFHWRLFSFICVSIVLWLGGCGQTVSPPPPILQS